MGGKMNRLAHFILTAFLFVSSVWLFGATKALAQSPVAPSFRRLELGEVMP
jgi:hypothetical protein